MENENIGTNEVLDTTEAVEEVVENLTEDAEDSFIEATEECAPKKKCSFFSELSKQAVCKLFFLFAGIGFFFPFFTISCMNAETGALQDSGYPALTGLDMIAGKKVPFLDLFYGSTITADNGLEPLLTRSALVLAAFAVICLGLILTLIFKGKLRSIFGLICSGASAIILGIFAFTLNNILRGSILSYLQSATMTDFLAQYGLDPTSEEALQMFNLESMYGVLGTGFWFVMSLMVINFIYFLVMLIKGDRKCEPVLAEIDTSCCEDCDIGDIVSDCEEASECASDECAESSEEAPSEE